MANRNGMGPMNAGPLTGRGLGHCSTGNNNVNIGKVGLGIGAGLGMAWGCMNGMKGRGLRMSGSGRGRWFQALQGQSAFGQTDDQDALRQYKEQLESEIEAINNRINQSEKK